jgi:HPt (histidine-containing phosphotransfer) domain-containing protein
MDRAPHQLSAVLTRDGSPHHDTQDELASVRRELALVRHSQQLLSATLDAAGVGILALQHSDAPPYFNSHFTRMWDIPEAQIGHLDRDALMGLLAARARQPRQLFEITEQRPLDHEQNNVSRIEMLDGRMLECESGALRILGRCVGSVMTFRAMTPAAALNAHIARPAAPADAVRKAAPAADGELPEGIPGLDTALGLSLMMGKKPLYLEVLARFVRSQRGTAEDIAMSLALGDAATAQRLAHTAKSVARSIGATTLQAVDAELEQALKDGLRGAALQQRLRNFESTLSTLIGALAPCL